MKKIIAWFVLNRKKRFISYVVHHLDNKFLDIEYGYSFSWMWIEFNPSCRMAKGFPEFFQFINQNHQIYFDDFGDKFDITIRYKVLKDFLFTHPQFKPRNYDKKR